ncbi:CMGC family protein kinase [Tritrichomonas foetus]|uniref:non-specific serine/threonine protein kinase n=1 Tax=Tritrichomonas foetus TaxID=1144522 RepID=A0A1J4KMZ7_9EUKA|nr:CMGC family protein kinase [Tritrichomonas foetus]|eukprot:OHT12272.1 CMGC family protein kinase [Tritrichomonas foetus]
MKKGEEKGDSPFHLSPDLQYPQTKTIQFDQFQQQSDLALNFGNIDDYLLVERIGRGKYSTVFLGRRTKDDSPCVLKILKPVCLAKINKEIKILEELKGGPNVCELYDVVYDPESQSITLVMEYIENVDFRVLYDQFTLPDLKYYMYQILKCLKYAHSLGIMHRDIKPQNIMIDHSSRKVRIIDWGLADHFVPKTQYQVRVATIHYKAPELLFGYPYYDFSVDIWGLGCTFASLIFRRVPFFRGRDNNEMVWRLVSFFGSEEVDCYLKKFNIVLPTALQQKMVDHHRKSWNDLKNEKNEDMFDADAVDLLSKMLVIDHTMRITAEEAMKHKFFDGVRDDGDE